MSRKSSCRVALFAIAVLGLAMASSQAGAASMAVDLGSEFLKISVVKPGRIPISIVNNEMSKRKSPAAVAFIEGDRLLGDEAAALAVRYPERVFTRLRDLLGARHDDPVVQRIIKNSRLPLPLVQAPNRTTLAVTTDLGDIHSAEVLVASLLEYAKTLATAAADGSPITDCVLVVPVFFGPAQRRALLDAADLAGLNVLSLVHAHAAAALQYGIERDFANKTEDVMFVDIGAGASQAALVRFSAFDGPAGTPPISQFEVRDVAWVEHGVGGDALEAAMIEHFASQHADGADAVLSSPRAVEKLRRQVKRTKTVLSANTESQISVEDLLPGKDFRGRMTREELETLAGSVWERSVAPVAEILKRNNITGEDLAAVELLGGSSRVPRLKAALSEVLGGRNLDMHLDADEAVVLGAGLVAANLSTIFRLRKFGMTDKTPYSVLFALEGADEQGVEAPPSNEPRVLVPAFNKMPTRRAIALHNLTSDSFNVELETENSAGAVLPCCQRKEALGAFTVSGIAAVVDKHGYSGKVALHTSVDHNGVFKVDKADASLEIEEPVPILKPSKNTAAANSTGTATNGTDAEAAGTEEGASTNSTTTAAAEGGDGGETVPEDKTEATIPEGTAEATPEEGTTEEVPIFMRKRTLRIPLNVTGSLASPGLTPEQMTEARRTLRALRALDKAKRDTAKARNDLESYIIATRDKLDSNEELKAVSTEAQREEISASLMDAEDWLYGDGDKVAANEYRTKLSAVRKGGDAIESRAAEAAARPTATKAALEFVELVLKATNAWPTLKPWLNETDVAKVVAAAEGFRDWMTSSMAEQEKNEAHEDPVFTTKELAQKMDVARKLFTRLNNKSKPLEKPPPAPAKEEEKKDEKKEKETIPEPKGEDEKVEEEESGDDKAGADKDAPVKEEEAASGPDHSEL